MLQIANVKVIFTVFFMLRSAGLNHHLPTDPYCTGVSNKHYLFTLFSFLLLPILVSLAGFSFWLYQFLIIAYVLLLPFGDHMTMTLISRYGGLKCNVHAKIPCRHFARDISNVT